MPYKPYQLAIRQFAAIPLANEKWPVQPQFRVLQDMTVLRGYRKKRHRHFRYRLILPIRGTYKCLLNGMPLRLRPGQALLIKPGDWHADRFAPRAHILGLGFRLVNPDEPGVDVPVFAAGVRPDQQVMSNARATVLSLLRRLQQDSGTRDGYSVWIRNATMLQIVGHVLRLLPPQALSPQLKGFVSPDLSFSGKLKHLFAERVHHRTGVADLAAGMQISASALTQKCRQLLGVPPAKAFRFYRAQYALTLLRQTNQSVQVIAEDLGFRNPFHFSRLMRSVHGLPPSRLRRSPHAPAPSVAPRLAEERAE
jgi:AraC-like DNA-binding protein